MFTPVILLSNSDKAEHIQIVKLRQAHRQAVNGRTYKHSQQKYCTSNRKLFRLQRNNNQQPVHSQTFFPHGFKNYHIFSLTTKRSQ